MVQSVEWPDHLGFPAGINHHDFLDTLDQGKKVQNFSRNFSRLSQQELSKMETEMKAIQQEILNCAGLGELQKDAEILKF